MEGNCKWEGNDKEDEAGGWGEEGQEGLGEGSVTRGRAGVGTVVVVVVVVMVVAARMASFATVITTTARVTGRAGAIFSAGVAVWRAGAALVVAVVARGVKGAATRCITTLIGTITREVTSLIAVVTYIADHSCAIT